MKLATRSIVMNVPTALGKVNLTASGRSHHEVRRAGLEDEVDVPEDALLLVVAADVPDLCVWGARGIKSSGAT